MTLRREQLNELLELIGVVEEHEISCEEFLTRLPRYLETVRDRIVVTDEHRELLQHIKICPYCREELDGLLDAIDDKLL